MAATSTSDLTGNFYQAYGAELISLIPPVAKLAKMVEFDDVLGDKFNQPVIVQQETGFTYAAAGAGAFTLQASSTMATQNAQVDGSQLVLRATMDYETAAKASSSKKSFVRATQAQVKNMLESTWTRLEIDCWYGQTGLGKTSGADTNIDSTNTTVLISAATFAPLIWSGQKGAKVVFYNGSTAVASGHAFTVTSVDVTTRKINFSGASADITSLDTASSSALDIYWYTSVSGSLSFAQMAGVDKILTTSGTLFNIVNTTYDLFKGASFSIGSAQLTFGKLLQGVALAVGRGLAEDVDVWVSPNTFTDLMSDQAALRRYNASETKFENGANGLTFHHMNGAINIVGHGVIKAGEAFIMPTKKRFKRIGAQDVSFKTPGRPDGDDIFLHNTDIAGFEYRLYSHQALFCEAPAKCVKLTGIVNSA